MQFNMTVLFINGSRNLLPDALSRLWQDSSSHQCKHHEVTYMHQADDFIMPITRLAAVHARTAKNNKLSNNGVDRPIELDKRSLNPYTKIYGPRQPIPACPPSMDRDILFSDEIQNF